ncbi:hypothetical protein Misp01_81670 [Microtetraspora sp. NBRC 13810]|uniref:DUF305 domain-containing protein n=1 Tax=Microtetraspora sp. NBRC 13810 TaxID=3030990 RepID=UPI0024A5DEC1|nr:DUF305 domain-containing protein [Microtetraspora sp. NBRC 13810]GLW13039.1 hypothetical protein Misp01_81670 [Microtetraspora sp. NBRC 13810]
MRTVAVAALAAGLLATGCAATGTAAPAVPGPAPATTLPATGLPATTLPATTTPATTAPARVAGGFNPTDRAWMQLVIPMIEQTLRMLESARDRAADPEVRRLAADIGQGHRAELDRLYALRTRAGIPTTNVHQGHDMPGMPTPGELATLGRASGAAFHRLFTAGLREHLEQSIVIARGERESGEDGATRALAADIEKARRAQLDRLDRLAPAT